MAEEKKIGTPDEESNIDQINRLVTGSQDQNTESEKPQAIELNEHSDENEKTEPKPVPIKTNDKKKPEHKKVEQKPKVEEKHEIKTHNHRSEAKKPQPKKVIKVEPINASKKNKEISKPKILSAKKPSKEEKMAVHKAHKKSKSKFRKNTMIWIGIGVLAVIIIIALIWLLMPTKPQPTPGNETVKSVAATVNGEPIYLQDVLREYNNINPLVKSTYSVESVLNKTIDDTLLYQEAKTQGMSVTPDEIQAELDLIKTQYQWTDADLEDALSEQGLTVSALKEIIEQNLMIRKLLNATVLQDITVTESQIQKYYLQNIKDFDVPAKVTVQHILIIIDTNVTDAQAKAKIEQVQKELTSTNFCELVTKYSQDLGSLDTCGTYTFAKGDFNNPDFENPSFDLKVGEVTIVKTTFGYHLIKKLESIAATTLNISDVKQEINTTIQNDIAQVKFDALLESLKSKAVIINYMTKQGVPLNNTEDETPASLDTFAQCITEKGAVFYGASWCPHCNNQKQMFGESVQYIKYVECAVEGAPQVQTPQCTQAGISGYPTWIINGKSYPGEQTLNNLAKLTGCSLP